MRRFLCKESGRRGVFNKPPGFPIDVGAACTPPGNVAVARNVPGHANLHGGVKTPPYSSSHTFAAKFPCGVAAGWGSRGLPAAVRRGGEAAVSLRLSGGVKTPPYGKREHGSSDRRSQQDKIARAACRPPLRPNGNSQFSIFVRNLRKVVGRGLDPAAGTSRQARRFQQTARFSYRCRGGVYAARERCGCPERTGPRKFARRGTTPPYRVTGNGRPAGRPYSRTGIGNFYFGFATPARMHKPPVRGGFLFRSGFPRFSTGGFSAVYLCF